MNSSDQEEGEEEEQPNNNSSSIPHAPRLINYLNQHPYYKQIKRSLISISELKQTRRLFVFGNNIQKLVTALKSNTTTKITLNIDSQLKCGTIKFSSPVSTEIICNLNSDINLHLFCSKKTRGVQNFSTSTSSSSSAATEDDENNRSDGNSNNNIITNFVQQQKFLSDAEGSNNNDNREHKQPLSPPISRLRSRTPPPPPPPDTILHQEKTTYNYLVELLWQNRQWTLPQLVNHIESAMKNNQDQKINIIGIIGKNKQSLENIIQLNLQCMEEWKPHSAVELLQPSPQHFFEEKNESTNQPLQQWLLPPKNTEKKKEQVIRDQAEQQQQQQQQEEEYAEENKIEQNQVQENNLQRQQQQQPDTTGDYALALQLSTKFSPIQSPPAPKALRSGLTGSTLQEHKKKHGIEARSKENDTKKLQGKP